MEEEQEEGEDDDNVDHLKGANRHRMRARKGYKNSGYHGDLIRHEEHPEWRENWRPWLRAKAIKSVGATDTSELSDYEEDDS